MKFRNESEFDRYQSHTGPVFKSDSIHLLREVAELLKYGSHSLARSMIDRLSRQEDSATSEGIRLQLFLRALSRRVDGGRGTNANLYLQRFENRQIDLFNLIATRMPLVTVAAASANALILEAMTDLEEVTLIDVGIGTGRQEVELLHRLKMAPRGPRHIRIIGIEPAAEALTQAKTTLKTLAHELGISLSFTGIGRKCEEMTPSEWAKLREDARGAIINEAFALHHISPSSMGIEQKTRVIRELAALEPARIIACEPHSNHETTDLTERLENAWNHFGLVFHFIDQLSLSTEEREAMKVQFFGREIEDILGQEEPLRTERHETAEMWLERFDSAGMKPCVSSSALLEAKRLATGTPLEVRDRKNYMSLGVDENVIVGIMSFTRGTSRSVH